MKISIAFLATTLLSIAVAIPPTQKDYCENDSDIERCKSSYLPIVPDPDLKHPIMGGYRYLNNCSEVPREVIDLALSAIEAYMPSHTVVLDSVTRQLVNGYNYGVIASAVSAHWNYECKTRVYDGPFSNTQKPSVTLTEDGVCCYRRHLEDMARQCLPK
ncbi:hypothetical protein BGZ75_004224 [Mortierella antarctica]|nr:hypothetical protein BGZ75_004224 [Mortierella antarctica]